MNFFCKIFLENKLYLLKYFSFAVLSCAGLIRMFLFSYEELGSWREIASLFTIIPQVLLLGLPGYLLLRSSEEEASLILHCSINILLYIYILGFILMQFFTELIDYFSYLVVVLVSIELLMAHIYIKRGEIKKLTIIQTMIYSVEIVALLISNFNGLVFDVNVICLWMFFRSFLISIVVLFDLRKSIDFLHLVNPCKLFDSFKFAGTKARNSIGNNYAPMVLSVLLMNFDGLVLVHFLSIESIGFIAVIIFFRSVLLIPLTLAGQKLSPFLKDISDDTYLEFRIESKKALYFVMLIILPCFCIFYLAQGIKGEIKDGYLFLTLIVLFSLIVTYIGPVHTYLQALGKGKSAFLIDLIVLLLLFTLVFLYKSGDLNLLLIFYIFFHSASYFLKFIYLKNIVLKRKVL
jgi:hypothetical protein